MSISLRSIAASLVAGFVCAAPIGALTAQTDGSVDARATDDQSPPGEGGKGESERDVVARLFLRSTDHGVVRVTNDAYPWRTVGNVYWVYDYDQRRVFVVVSLGDGKPPIRLTGDSKAVATFISKQSGGRFAGVDAIARLLADVTVSPNSTIGTPDLLLDPADLRDWLRGRQKDPTVFKSVCTGVKGHQRGNEWQLQFNVFKTNGGVDAVSAAGSVSPFTIRKLNVTPLKPAGEFYYPFAG